MNYPEAVEYIMKTPKFRENNEQGPSAQLIDRLGHPEEAFRILHVAGTNGKGSVCAFLESMLRHAGYRTGLYTSPHLVRINERFMIDRKNVDDEAFADRWGDLGPVYGKQWRNFDDRGVDQITQLIENLKNDPFSRRHLVVAYNPAQVEDMALPPVIIQSM